MENQPLEPQDDLPVSTPVMDESLERAQQQVTGLDDDQVVRKIGSRTTMFGRVVAVSLLVGIVALGYVWYTRSQASEHRWDAYREAQASGSEQEFLSRVREELPRTQFDDVRMRIMQKMGQYHDAQAVPVLVPFLEHGGRLRAHAARALAEIGSPGADAAKPHLMRALPTTTDADRAPVVWALAVLGESGASDAIIEEFESGRLQHQHHPAFDPRVIVSVVGVARLGTPELTAHSSGAVRTLVAQALAEAATPDVIEPLSRMLSDPQNNSDDPDEREVGANILRMAASGLGRIGDPRAARPLFELMQRDPAMRVAVLDALRRSTGARGLTVLLESASDATIKRDLAIMIRATHDPVAADALAGLLSSDDELTRIEAAHGLAEIGDVRAVPTLVTLAQSDSSGTGRDALDALMLVQSPDVVGAIGPMLEDERFLNRRSGVMRVLGRSGAASAGPVLVRNLEGDDIASAAMALAELDDDGGYTALMRIIPRPRGDNFAQYGGMAGVPLQREYDNRTAAVRAIGRYGRPDAGRALMTIIEDPEDDVRLRADAGLALGAIADEAILQAALAKIQQTDLDEHARRYYLGALWQRPMRSMSGTLMDLINNPATPPDVRRPTAVAVGYAADPANDARLITMLESEQTRSAAAIAIALGGSPEAGHALLTAIQNSDELRQQLQDDLMNSSTDWFNLLTVDLWDSGEVMRRIQVAKILNDGGQGMAWQPLMARLRSGWSGLHGLSARDVRMRLFEMMRGTDEAQRALAAHLLGATQEIGLLMAARDAGGSGSEEARAELTRINRPQQETEAAAQEAAQEEREMGGP